MDITDLIANLGLDLPRILGINVATEFVRNELETLGLWVRVRSFGWLLPILVAVFICFQSGETLMGAIPCGLMYGAAAIFLHDSNDAGK